MIVELSSKDVLRLTADGEIEVGGVVTLKMGTNLSESVVNGAASMTPSNALPATVRESHWMPAKFAGRCAGCRTRVAKGDRLYRDYTSEKARSLCGTCGDARENELKAEKAATV